VSDLVTTAIGAIENTVTAGEIVFGKHCIVGGMRKLFIVTAFDVDFVSVEYPGFFAAEENLAFIGRERTTGNLHDVHELCHGILFGFLGLFFLRGTSGNHKAEKDYRVSFHKLKL